MATPYSIQALKRQVAKGYGVSLQSPLTLTLRVMELNIQDLTWINIALRQLETSNPDLIAKCKTFDATKEKVEEMTASEVFKLACE